MILQASEISSRDELLGVDVTLDLIEEAESELYLLATKLNIAVDEVKPTPTVKRFIRAYIFTEIAKTKTYASGPIFNAEENFKDVYGEKLKLYKEELTQLTNAMSRQALTGVVERRGFRAVNIYRG